MRLTVAALVAIAPLATLAQGTGELIPPPPPPPVDVAASPAAEKGARDLPAPEAKAMSAAYVPRYHSRDAWFVGFGLGTGGVTVYGEDGWWSLRRLVGPGPRVGAARFEIGATLSDRLLLGVELSGVGAQQDYQGTRSRVLETQANAVLSFFPEADGLFIRLGGGACFLRRSHAGAVVNDRGWDGLVGLGYAFWIGQRFNLSLRVDHSRQRWTTDHGLRTGESWTATAGFDWF